MDDFGIDGAVMFGPFRLDPVDERVSGPQGVIHIGNKAFRVLAALIAQRGRLLTKDALFETVWDGAIVSESSLTSVIKELRRALGDDSRDPRFIESVYGRGYRFIADVTIAPPDRETPTAGPDRPLIKPAPKGRSRWLGGAAAAFLIAVAGVGSYLGGTYLGLGHSAAKAGQPVIAVLPFVDMQGSSAQPWLAEGMGEEVLDTLSRDSSLKIIGRTTASALGGKMADLPYVHDTLGITQFLEGSIRPGGARGDIRVSVRLIDTRDGSEIWSQVFDRKGSDQAAAQQDVAWAVGNALHVRLYGAAPPPVVKDMTNQRAYNFYLRGRQLRDALGNEADLRTALKAYDDAIAADPDFAAAYAGREAILVVLTLAYLPENEMEASAKAALTSAQTAVRLAPDLPEAQSALGSVLATMQLDFAAAAPHYARARELGSGNPDVLLLCATFEARIGRIDEAISTAREAIALDPLNPGAYRVLTYTLNAGHLYADALAAARRGRALNPKMTLVHSLIAENDIALRRYDDAARELAMEPLSWIRLTDQAILAAARGNLTEARAGLDAVHKLDDMLSYQEAEILAQIGDHEAAIAMLQRSWKEHDRGLHSLRTDPFLDPLRGDPRFKALDAAIFGRV